MGLQRGGDRALGSSDLLAASRQLRHRMNPSVPIVPIDWVLHRKEVVELWKLVFGYETAHNEPNLVLRRKQEADDGLLSNIPGSGQASGSDASPPAAEAD